METIKRHRLLAIAVLTADIGAAIRSFRSDVSAFPAAPNYATIGSGNAGETVIYTAKTASALSGCTRGVEGAAAAWSAGELIGRNFTAADHAALIENINALDTGKVPTARTVNGKALSANVSLSAADVGAVPTARTINGKALSADISLTASDVSAVPTARTVNGKTCRGCHAGGGGCGGGAHCADGQQ
jgi:hypothetical protein